MASLPRCPKTSKIMYPNRDAAIKRALISSRKRGVALRIYSCPICRSLHLTSQREYAPSKLDIRNERFAS